MADVDHLLTAGDGRDALARAHIVRGDIDSLIRAMPCLVRKGAPQFGTDNARWKAWIRSSYLSGGEMCAATFILHVWNHYDDKKARALRFDLARAINVWDDAHRATFIAWAADPWYA